MKKKIVVYTNSRKRAVEMAVLTERFYIKEKGKESIRIKPELLNNEGFLEKLELQISIDGFFRVNMGNNEFLFIYADDDTFRLCSLSEYDETYRLPHDVIKYQEAIKLLNLPYFPLEFQLAINENSALAHDALRGTSFIAGRENDSIGLSEALDKRLNLYQQIVSSCSAVYNAASDDIAGEFSFYCFKHFVEIVPYVPGTFDSKPIGKEILRIRPQTFNSEQIVESLTQTHLPETEPNLQQVGDASALLHDLDWLIFANISLYLQKNLGPVPFRLTAYIGRWECVLLWLIAARAEESEKILHNPKFCVRAVVKADNGTQFIFRTDMQFNCEAEAMAAADVIKKKQFFVNSIEYLRTPMAEPLKPYNCFNLQIDACKKGLTAVETVQCARNLFEKGYISWPTDSDLLPNSIRPQLSRALSALHRLPENQNQEIPSDTRKIDGWDSDSLCKERFEKHTGILTTERIPGIDDGYNLSANEKLVYELISRREISMATQNVASMRNTIRGSSEDLVLTFTQNWEGPTSEYTKKLEEFDKIRFLQENKSYEILKVSIEPAVELANYQNFTEAELLQVFINSVCGSGTPIFINNMSLFSTAIENLVKWHEIERDGDGRFQITKSGEAVMAFIDDTVLTDFGEVSYWNEKLEAISRGNNGHDVFTDVIKNYVSEAIQGMDRNKEILCSVANLPKCEWTCPICGERMNPGPDNSWMCEGGSCKFTIPAQFRGHAITPQDRKNLIKSGITHEAYYLQRESARNGYMARIGIDKKGKCLRSDYSTPFSCPICHNMLSQYQNMLICRKEQQGCGYSLCTQKYAHSFTTDELLAMLSGDKTPLIDTFKGHGDFFSAYARLRTTDLTVVEVIKPTNN